MIRSLIGRGFAALAALPLAFASPALASSIVVKDGNSTSQTLGTTTRPSDGAQVYNMDTVVQSAAADIGASIAANTATQIVAATTTRRGFSIQNQTSGACYVNGTTTATADYHSLLIPAGSYYETKDSHTGTGALSVICTSAGGVYARQW